MDFSEEEFIEKTSEFLNLSEKLNDTWKKHEKDGKICLVKNIKIFGAIAEDGGTSVNLDDCKLIENEDPSEFDPGNKVLEPEMLSAEYHLVYHVSYQIPVIYFNFYRSDGSLVNLEEVWNIFQRNSNFQAKDDLLNVITQSEHPILFRPFFLLHPCKTSEVLSLFSQSKNFILTFLTIFGPTIGLKMNPEYQKFFID